MLKTTMKSLRSLPRTRKLLLPEKRKRKRKKKKPTSENELAGMYENVIGKTEPEADL